MHTSTMVQSLALFTLLATLAAVGVAYLLFMRKRTNRHPEEAPTRPEGAFSHTGDDSSSQ